MRHLCDSNVFVALTVHQHPAHETTRAWLGTLVADDKLGLCRVVEMSFLRLLTQRIADGYQPVKNREAVQKLMEWKNLPFVEFCPEPEGTEEEWLRLAGADRSAPKRWMDSYLAAFAIRGTLRLVTLDNDFAQWKAEGLDLLPLKAIK